jgi:hypothetical protein
MFTSDRQKSHCIQTLLDMVNLGGYWNVPDVGPTGPSADGIRAFDKIEQHLSPLSAGENILVLVAFDFWNGAGKASIWEMMNVLDSMLIRAIGELITAVAQPSDYQITKWRTNWQGVKLHNAPNGFTIA